MSRWALIQGDRVWEVFDGDRLPPYHPALEWIDATAIVPAPQVGWGYDRDTETFAPPPPPPPPDNRLTTLTTAIDAAVADATLPARLRAVLSAWRDVVR